MQEIFDNIADNLKAIILWLTTIAVDTLFLIGWVVIQHQSNRFISNYPLSEFDSQVFFIFQYAFAISTLIPVTLFIYKDISIMLIRTQRQIQEARDI